MENGNPAVKTDDSLQKDNPLLDTEDLKQGKEATPVSGSPAAEPKNENTGNEADNSATDNSRTGSDPESQSSASKNVGDGGNTSGTTATANNADPESQSGASRSQEAAGAGETNLSSGNDGDPSAAGFGKEMNDNLDQARKDAGTE